MRILLSLLVLALIGCATSPTGRSQLILFPEEMVAELAVSGFQDLKREQTVAESSAATSYVDCIAQSIISVADSTITDWETVVFDEDAVNAFALPGGKIGVYTGMLEVAETPDQLAAVLGHEVGHVLARHGNERLSTSLTTQSIIQAAAAAHAGDEKKTQLIALVGVGAQLGVVLPFGRAQETEADLIGLRLMSKAGFDPSGSVELWQNMAQESKSPPQFLSTHPSHESRIAFLTEHMAEAQALYQATTVRAPCSMDPDSPVVPTPTSSVDEKAPSTAERKSVPLPASTAATGDIEVVLHTSMLLPSPTGLLNITHDYVLFKDGTICDCLEEWLADPLLQQFRRKEPNEIGVWRRATDKYEMRFPGDDWDTLLGAQALLARMALRSIDITQVPAVQPSTRRRRYLSPTSALTPTAASNGMVSADFPAVTPAGAALLRRAAETTLLMGIPLSFTSMVAK